VELLDFEKVDYWEELCEIMDWSKTNVHSTMHICWGAQAGLYHHYGIKKYELPKKLFGVFPHKADYAKSMLLRGFDGVFHVPHSRYTAVKREEIEAIAEEHNAAPEKRLAQKKLAEEILRDLHGEGAYESAVKISEQLFSGNIKEIPLNDLLAGLKDVPHFTTAGGNVMDVLVSAGICSSKREAREFISGGSLTLNGEPLRATDVEINADACLGGKYLVVRRGKKKYYLGELE
jgi:hypothetical protein